MLLLILIALSLPPVIIIAVFLALIFLILHQPIAAIVMAGIALLGLISSLTDGFGIGSLLR